MDVKTLIIQNTLAAQTLISIKIGIIFCSLLLSACAGIHKPDPKHKNRANYLSHQLIKTQARLERFKAENFVLRKKIKKSQKYKKQLLRQQEAPNREFKKNHSPRSTQRLAKRKTKSKTMGRSRTQRTPVIKSIQSRFPRHSINPKLDDDLYRTILTLYENQQGEKLYKYVKKLLTEYPKSIYGDNALYLQGKYLYTRFQYFQAIASFDQALELFPKGNKRAAILLAKSRAYKKLNLASQAQSLLKKIIVTYPSSMEAQRAQMELSSTSMKNRDKM